MNPDADEGQKGGKPTQNTDGVEKHGGGKDYVPRDKYNELKTSLDTTLEKLSKYETAAEADKRKKLEEEGKYQEILKEKEDTISTLKAKAEEWDTFQTKEREVLLAKIPESSREIFKDESLSKLKEIVEMVAKKPPETPVDHLPGREADSMGYNSPQEAARAKVRGDIDEPTYQKIFNYFRDQVH